MPDSNPNDVKASIYRYYDDTGVLIYVGFTTKGSLRNRQHAADKEWWPFVKRQKVKHFHDEQEALACERELIAHCRPPFNRQHNPDHAALRAAYLQCVGADIPDVDACDQYYEMRKVGLPLRVVPDRVDPSKIALVTLPEHAPLVMSFAPIKGVRLLRDGTPCSIGYVTRSKPMGKMLFLRAQLLDGVESVDDAYACVKMVSQKKPITTRIAHIRCHITGAPRGKERAAKPSQPS